MTATRPPGARRRVASLQGGTEAGQFLVHRDPQRLKRPGGRVNVSRPQPPGNRTPHHRREIRRRGDRPLLACRHDGSRDPTGPSLLAPLEDQVRQLLLGQVAEQIRRGPARAAVHAHIQRPLARERKAAFRSVHLERRGPQIEEDPVKVRGRPDQLPQRLVPALYRGDPPPERSQPLPGERQRLRIPVNPQQGPRRLGCSEDRLRVPAQPDGGVQVPSGRSRPEERHHFVLQDRDVNAHGHLQPAARAWPGAPVTRRAPPRPRTRRPPALPGLPEPSRRSGTASGPGAPGAAPRDRR